MLIAWLTGVAKKVDPRLWQFCRQRWGRNCKQAQERTSPNLGPSLCATPVHIWWRWCLFCKGHHIAGRLMSSFHVGCQYSIRCNDELDRHMNMAEINTKKTRYLSYIICFHSRTWLIGSSPMAQSMDFVWYNYHDCGIDIRLAKSFIVLGFQRYEMCHSPLLDLWGSKIWLPMKGKKL